jgi:hypothetical protein
MRHMAMDSLCQHKLSKDERGRLWRSIRSPKHVTNLPLIEYKLLHTASLKVCIMRAAEKHFCPHNLRREGFSQQSCRFSHDVQSQAELCLFFWWPEKVCHESHVNECQVFFALKLFWGFLVATVQSLDSASTVCSSFWALLSHPIHEELTNIDHINNE